MRSRYLEALTYFLFCSVLVGGVGTAGTKKKKKIKDDNSCIKTKNKNKKPNPTAELRW